MDVERLHKRLRAIKEEINKISSDGKKVNRVIDLCDQAYPLLGYIDLRLQEEFYYNLRDLEHRYYLDVDYYVYLKTCVNTIDRVIKIISAEKEFPNLMPTQTYYLKGQKVKILNDLDQIFKSAKNSILYYDSYMDYFIISILEDLNVKDVKLLLLNPGKKFKSFAEALREERDINVSYKTIKSKDLHDRFCLVDSKYLWQIGGSINSKPIKGITITKITDHSVKNDIIEDLNNIWRNS